MPDSLENNDRVYLDKLRLTAQILIRAGEETELVNGVLESELHLLQDAVERALLLSPDTS